MNSNKVRVNTSLTAKVLAEADKLIADAVHSTNQPQSYADIKIYYDKAVDSVLPDYKVDFLTLDWGMLKEHQLGYLEELAPEEFRRIRTYNSDSVGDTVFINYQPAEPITASATPVEDNNVVEDITSISYTDIKSDEFICIVRRKSPKTFLDLVKIYDNELASLPEESIANIDFSVILHDMVNYAVDNFGNKPDYNIFFLNDNETIRERGYDYFLEFRDDVINAYENENNWFYTYVCEGCGEWIYMKRGEVQYYKDKHLRMPKRCKNCRNNRAKKIKEGK